MTTFAPRLAQNFATAMPVCASPTTTTVLPARSITSPHLQRAERDEREQRRDQPEPDDDLGLVPALHLVVVMDRRHAEHALADHLAVGPRLLRRLVDAGLDDDGQRLHHEQAAD